MPSQHIKRRFITECSSNTLITSCWNVWPSISVELRCTQFCRYFFLVIQSCNYEFTLKLMTPIWLTRVWFSLFSDSFSILNDPCSSVMMMINEDIFLEPYCVCTVGKEDEINSLTSFGAVVLQKYEERDLQTRMSYREFWRNNRCMDINKTHFKNI